MDDTEIEGDAKYILLRSASPAIASASNKLGTWVSIKIGEGWSPHGSPQLHHDGEKFYLIQAMIKS
tara:strand:- start:385 stop:582 length:198 start_codon:yes stop_codon:yes gene_type:complete